VINGTFADDIFLAQLGQTVAPATWFSDSTVLNSGPRDLPAAKLSYGHSSQKYR